MSNVLIGIIGVIFFIGLAIAGASFFGPAIFGSRVDAEATDYLNQSSQIAHALEAYSSDNGKLPIGGGTEPVSALVSYGYMKTRPPGGRSPWEWNAQAKAILTPAGRSDVEGMKVCIAARKRAGMPDPDRVKACNGSGGELRHGDPCCLI